MNCFAAKRELLYDMPTKGLYRERMIDSEKP